MTVALQAMASLVEHNLINRGLIPLAMRDSVPVAKAMLEAPNPERVTVLLESAIRYFHDLETSETVEDGEFLYKVAQLLKAG